MVFQQTGTPERNTKMHYYDAHQFTETQAEHALNVVLELMRTKRFFLQKRPRTQYPDEDFTLDPRVFREAILLDRKIIDLYAETKAAAVAKITAQERALGVKPAQLSESQELVDCNRYTGGFDICRIYPLSEFMPFVPESLDALVNEQCQTLLRGRSSDDITPRTLRELNEQGRSIALRIWNELHRLDIWDMDNDRCVVMLGSRSACHTHDTQGDFAQSRVSDIQDTPYATGYLFWKYSRETRIVPHDFVVFGTKRDSHVRIEHWAREEASIDYSRNTCYDCPVKFATIL
jgi:hypothetical protein